MAYLCFNKTNKWQLSHFYLQHDSLNHFTTSKTIQIMGNEKECRDLFVPYEIAVKLKELGFNETCLTKYGMSSYRFYEDFKPYCNSEDLNESGTFFSDDLVAAPLWQQAFDWFRSQKLTPSWIYKSEEAWYYKIEKGDFWIQPDFGIKNYDTVRKNCLQKLIEIATTLP